MGEDNTDHDHPDIPKEVRSTLSRFNQLSGNIGTSSRLDWTEQTLSVVGQFGRNPDAFEDEGREFMLDMFDDQVGTVIIDEFDGLALLERDIDDNGFRYEFDLSAYLEKRSYVLNIAFDDYLQGEGPERFQEYLEEKDVDESERR